MGKFNEIAATDAPVGEWCLGKNITMKNRRTVGSALGYSAKHHIKTGRDYTQEERSRGGIKCAANKRDRAHNAIDLELAAYVKCEEMQAQLNHRHRICLIDFVKVALPWIKDSRFARRQYGQYIKARLKFFQDSLPVVNLASLVNKIRSGIAKKIGKPAPTGVFEAMKGWVHRLSSNMFCTSYRHIGGEWMATMGIWGQWVDCDTGEIL